MLSKYMMKSQVDYERTTCRRVHCVLFMDIFFLLFLLSSESFNDRKVIYFICSSNFLSKLPGCRWEIWEVLWWLLGGKFCKTKWERGCNREQRFCFRLWMIIIIIIWYFSPLYTSIQISFKISHSEILNTSSVAYYLQMIVTFSLTKYYY